MRASTFAMRFHRQRRLTATLVVVLLGAVLFPVSAVDYEEGRLRLTLHEEVGRFSLSYRADLSSSEFTPLFFARDPRTSSVTVTDGEQIYRLGDSGAFRVETLTDEESPGFLFTSGVLEVRQTFSFVTSAEARLTNGVQMTLRIRNVSETERNVRTRVLVDSYLGEEDEPHFVLANDRGVAEEGSLDGPSFPRFWVSRAEDGERLGLHYALQGPSVSAPEEVVFANWKRLSDSRFEFTVDPGRSFSLLPYSINDSAVAVYYPGATLEPGDSRTIRTFIGNYDPAGYGVGGATSDLAGMLDDDIDPESLRTREGLLQEVIAADELIDEINDLLANPEAAGEEDLELIYQILSRLEARKDAISDQ